MMDHHHSLIRKSTGGYNPTTLNSLTRKRQCPDANSVRVELNDDQNKSSDDISFEDGTFITDVVEITESRNINKMLEFRILRKDQKKHEWVANSRVIAPELVAKFLGEQALIKDVRHILGKRTTDTGDIQYLVQRESSKHNIPEWIDCLKLLAPDKISKYEQSEAKGLIKDVRHILGKRTTDTEDIQFTTRELNDDQNKSSDCISSGKDTKKTVTFITDVVEITAARYHKAFEFKILRKDKTEYEWVSHYRVIAPEAVANFLGNNALIKDVCQVFGKRIDKEGNIQYLVQRESSKSNILEWIDCLKLLAPDKISKYEESESDKKIRLNKDISFEDVYIMVDQNIVPREIIARVDICDELHYLARDEDDVLGLLPEKYLMDNYIEIVTKYYKLLAFNSF